MSDEADRLDSIAAKLDKTTELLAALEQKDKDRTWTDNVSRWAAYLAFAIFFIGVGTFTDLKDHILHPEQSQRERTQHINDLNEYFQAVGKGCPLPARDPRTGDQLRAEADARGTASMTWDGADDSKLSDAERIDVATARSYFDDATAVLRAMAVDIDRNDPASYDLQLSEYVRATTEMSRLLRPYVYTYVPCPQRFGAPGLW